MTVKFRDGLEINMSDFKYQVEISPEPVGFIVYIAEEGNRLSLASFCASSGMEVLDLMKILTASSGFKPEPEDAIGFFLFEDAATKFVDAIKAAA